MRPWWSDEDMELLRKFHGEGLTASQISSEFRGKYSRNAICGKVHRLNLSGNPRNVKNEKEDESFWTTERVDALKEMVGKDYNLIYIAKELNTTVGAVAGKCHRMGCKIKRKVVSAHRIKQKKDNLKNEVPKVVQEKKFVPAVDVNQPEPLYLTFFELEDGQCKYEVKEEPTRKLYCGCPTGGKREPYCSYHKNLISHKGRK